MAFHFRQRWTLVLLLAVGQAVILIAASIWFSHWLERSLGQLVRQRVATSTAQYALQFGLLINELKLRELRPDAATTAGNADWRRLQELVERMKLPYDGFICIIDDADGHPLCHPRLRADDAVARESLGNLPLQLIDGGTGPIIRNAGASPNPDCGLVDMPGGRHLVAVRNLPELNAKLLIHQPERAILVAVDQFTTRVRTAAAVVSVALVLFTTLLTVLIVRGYESRLAHINENLETLVEVRSRALLKSRSAVIFGLAKLAESRDDQTGRHLERIRAYVTILGRVLAKRHSEFDDDFLETLGDTSSLHDIGKVGIPDAVLLSPAKLTEDQRRIIQKHTLIGGDTLLALKRMWGDDPFLVTACEVAFHHHERWDGTGYPFGLTGSDIPIAARIVALADVYDALTSKRVYKPAMSHEEARRIITEGSGKHFDPMVVEAFLASEPEFRQVLSEQHDA